MQVTTADAAFVRELLLQSSAVVIDAEKDYFIEMRLARLASDCGVESIEQLIAPARKGERAAAVRIVEALVTHETYFFRDVHPFDALRTEVLPQLIAAREATRRLTIWCAACSSGQEPYSVAMLLREHFPQLDQWQVRIIATDLSEQVLAKAREGVFTQMEVNRGLPAPMLLKHFERKGLHWQVSAKVRQLIEFRQLNLIDSWVVAPSPDVVFLRNVLIYFNPEKKRQILDRVRAQLQPGGVLFLGAAETTMNIAEGWGRIAKEKQTYYRVKDAS